ncbi:cactin [Cardiosporidium cionae]|uniref:Splicing factor Cactin n=1 Tax=Cardiosporidium cionae TaxID=476202 RepID=A0ABQ7JB98_9APIC|nr:cactin [Cardiosporidium cionae]|eukprot:KAF8821261.1 cactin [Cardiosporidium cionae]
MSNATADSHSSRLRSPSVTRDHRNQRSHEFSGKKRPHASSSSASSSSIASQKRRPERARSPVVPHRDVYSSGRSPPRRYTSDRGFYTRGAPSQNAGRRRLSPARGPSPDVRKRKYSDHRQTENAKISKRHQPTKSHPLEIGLSKRNSSHSRSSSHYSAPRRMTKTHRRSLSSSSHEHPTHRRQRSEERSHRSSSRRGYQRREAVSHRWTHASSSASRKPPPPPPHFVRPPPRDGRRSLSPLQPPKSEEKTLTVKNIASERKVVEASPSQPETSPSVSALLEASQKEPLGLRHIQKVRQHMVEERLGYTNESNPFGDSTLTQPFIWRKKNVLLKATGELKKPTVKSLLESTQKKVGEIEAVKKRREEREFEESLLEEQRQVMAREKEQEHFEEWIEKEEQFLREQAIKKTDMHIEQGRERSIDILMKGVNIIKGKTYPTYTLVMEILPYEIFEELSVDIIEETLKDILLFANHETNDSIKEFWLCLHSIGVEKAAKARRKEEEAKAIEASRFVAPYRDSDANIPLSVIKDIEAFLSEKSPRELRELEVQVKEKLSNITEDVDPTYWEAIQAKLPFFMARSVVMEMRSQWIKRIEELKQNPSLFVDSSSSPVLLDDLLLLDKDGSPALMKSLKKEILQSEVMEEDVSEECFSPELEPFDEDSTLLDLPGSCSPCLHPFEEFKNAELIDPVEDRREREEIRFELIHRERQKRKRILFNEEKLQSSVEGISHTVEEDIVDPATRTTTYDDFVRKEKKTSTVDEEIMSSHVEHPLQKHYDWEDKYRPRKPRYFNRVKTGYEWNKYNQTHYDHDNPPPKAVQGYKFNIFYPDLIDRTKTPTWHLQPSDNDDTVVIRFHAGPPYEDVAFKIINREWSLDRIRGFRNSFEKGILQLYFSFKRFRYRR